MSEFVVGQRYASEPEPELGLGVVTDVDGFRVALAFPAVGEKRLYASDTEVLRRVRYREGESVQGPKGQTFTIEKVEEEGGLIVYSGDGMRVREDGLSGVASQGKPQERLMAGQVDRCSEFDLRLECLRMRNRLRRSELRGFMGGRVDLIPHQFYILHEVSSRQNPRVLLSDEVGLGKTIEACLIIQRMWAIGRAERILILVPESLVHQWFVELLRRFGLWFSIFDEERCRAIERSNPGSNPFLDEQLALCSMPFLSQNEGRAEQSIEAGWDLVVVDEAHHLEWTPQSSSVAYRVVERLGQKSPGLLLLTATPTQLGLAGHFARLRLLDPDRYGDFEAFQAETEDYELVASIVGKVIDGSVLSQEDHRSLKRIFHRDERGLSKRLEDLRRGRRGAKESLIDALLDEHGTGRVVFRNTRASMKGFPKRLYCPAPLESGKAGKTMLARLARELEAEAGDGESEIRYAYKDDPRLEWLASFLRARRRAKALLICKSKRKALAVEEALRERLNVKSALFHEDLTLVQRDRNAAWFAEEDGARILICSEIGSEGRNFQFAHHLILFDLPLNPGLLEQRIGRLDRIGQTATIQIHVPYVVGSAQEWVAEWYHQGMDAFESSVHGGQQYVAAFRERVRQMALEYGSGKARRRVDREALEAFVEETAAFKTELDRKLRRGRDRLLELNSFNAEVAADVVRKIRRAEADKSLPMFLFELLEHFGVRVDEHEAGEFFLDPSHAFIEAFPSLPAEGMLATFDRERAIAREDIAFLSPDHSLVGDAIGLLINSDKGKVAFGFVESDTSNLMLEAVFELEPIAMRGLHIDRFLSPTPLRVLVDARGRDLSHEHDIGWTKAKAEDGEIGRFLDSPVYSREIVDAMISGAEEIAAGLARKVKAAARGEARRALSAEIERLEDLSKLNDAIRPEEIALAKGELRGVQEAIEQASLRLDSLRLIVMGEVDLFA